MSLLGDVIGGLTGATSGGQGGDLMSGLASLMGGESGGGNAQLMNLAMSVLNQQGGVQGLMESLQQQGLGEHVASWVGTGENMPISAEQIQNVIGSDQLGAIAQQAGLSHGDAASGLAAMLPQVIDKLSPEGSMLDNDLVKQGLGALASKFF